MSHRKVTSSQLGALTSLQFWPIPSPGRMPFPLGTTSFSVTVALVLFKPLFQDIRTCASQQVCPKLRPMVTTGETTVLWVFQAPPFPTPHVWSRNPHRRHSTEVFFLFALPTLFSYIWKNTFRRVYQHPKFLSVCSFGSAHHTEGFCAAGNHDDGLLVILCCHGPDFIWYLQCNPSKEILKWQNASIQIPILLYTEVTAWNSWLSFLLSLRRVMWFLAHGNVGGFTTHTSEASSLFIWLILFHNFLHIFSSPNSS